jgi:hypothetical protein
MSLVDTSQNIEGSVSTDQGAPFSPESSPVGSPSPQDLAPSSSSGNAFDVVLESLPVASTEDVPVEGVVETPEGESNPATPPSDTSVEIDYGFASELGLQHVEFDPESPLLQDFQAIAKDAGLNQEQVEKLVSGYLQSLDDSVAQSVGAYNQSVESLRDQTLETLKSEWGVDAYDQKMPRVAQLLKSTFSDEALDVLRSSADLGSSVALIKGFDAIAERFGESAFVTGSFATVTDVYTYPTSQAFMAEHREILNNPNDPEYAAYQARYMDLIKNKQKTA